MTESKRQTPVAAVPANLENRHFRSGVNSDSVDRQNTVDKGEEKTGVIQEQDVRRAVR